MLGQGSSPGPSTHSPPLFLKWGPVRGFVSATQAGCIAGVARFGRRSGLQLVVQLRVEGTNGRPPIPDG
jgi:hypothetical protein